ncbi:prepilin-type N-terminal cleavage/methylation domain-containing protein [Candidatus Berkelbacteria bacterium]|nr:prepilin-type N-terminal cleavage/methylation domain-containing protein [Candidatus Berkelbacteria bacterium]
MINLGQQGSGYRGQRKNAAYCLRPQKLEKGFTLIEMILYVGIAAVILLGVSIFSLQMLQSREKQRTIAEVEQAGLATMEAITQTIRNAEAITVPAQGSSSASLTLDVVAASDDPTVFDLSGGVIRSKKGASAQVDLTSGSIITASGLTFKNLSRNNTEGTVRVEFTLTRVNPASRNEFDYSKTFYGSASLRQ